MKKAIQTIRGLLRFLSLPTCPRGLTLGLLKNALGIEQVEVDKICDCQIHDGACRVDIKYRGDKKRIEDAELQCWRKWLVVEQEEV